MFLKLEYVLHGDLAEYVQTTPNAQREHEGDEAAARATLRPTRSPRVQSPPEAMHSQSPPVVLDALLTFRRGVGQARSHQHVHVQCPNRPALGGGTSRNIPPELLACFRCVSGWATDTRCWPLGFTLFDLLTERTRFLETPAAKFSLGDRSAETIQRERCGAAPVEGKPESTAVAVSMHRSVF